MTVKLQLVEDFAYSDYFNPLKPIRFKINAKSSAPRNVHTGSVKTHAVRMLLTVFI